MHIIVCLFNSRIVGMFERQCLTFQSDDPEDIAVNVELAKHPGK